MKYKIQYAAETIVPWAIKRNVDLMQKYSKISSNLVKLLWRVNKFTFQIVVGYEALRQPITSSRTLYKSTVHWQT